MKTTVERAIEQASQFVHENQGTFAANISYWTEAIAGQLLKFQFNEFKLEQISQKDIETELAKYL